MKEVKVKASINKVGLTIMVNGEVMPIIYPSKVWQAYPEELKEILRDNIALSSTLFVPQILDQKTINYETSRPIREGFLFKNGIYDMPGSAFVDKKPAIDYLKKFLNTVAVFKDNEIQIPRVNYQENIKLAVKMIIPFTFGKDSLLTAAVANEIGLKPQPVYFIEPAHAYEYGHKKALMEDFRQETGLSVEEVEYGPGRMRYGHLWKKNTELGWGLQTTEYALLALPFLHYYQATLIGLGNEHSCSEASLNEEGILTHWSAYDQHPDWTPQQSLLTSLVGGRKVRVLSLVEPLHEIAEIAILHRRYPSWAKFQTSCLAIGAGAKVNRWCQRCEKCGTMYAFMKALGIDTGRVGFTENLFDKEHFNLFQKLFTEKDDLLFYGVEEEVTLALYLAALRGEEGETLQQFNKQILPKFRRVAKKYVREFFSIYPTKNIPKNIEEKLLSIYSEEMNKVKEELKDYARL